MMKKLVEKGRFRTFLLGDICDVRDGTHDSPKSKDIGHPLVTSKHIKNYKIDFSSANNISTEDFRTINKRSKVDRNDILISMIGTVGELAFIDYDPTFAIKNIGLIKPGDELLGRYLFYYLQSPKAKHYIEASIAGSTQKFIGLSLLRKFPIELPDDEVQEKVVDVLSKIDTKIELNRKMNATLEQAGQALFRHYFINNPDAEKWGRKSLYNIANVINGAPFSSKLFNEVGKGRPLIRIRDLKSQEPKIWTTENHKKGRLIEAGDIIAGMDAEFRPIVWARDDAWLNQRVCLFEPKISTISKLFLLETIRPQLAFYESTKIGTTVIHLSKTDIDRFTYIDAPQAIMTDFATKTEAIYSQQLVNSQEIQTLTTLRDTLLPRLISGKLKVE